ncbi:MULTISPECIES: arginine deiminase-related protein [Pseudomonas]|uniref:arginine deiminase-related protein n=1 Tax=Pseudomonas TaxID=286 RepID=UPI0009EC1DCB
MGGRRPERPVQPHPWPRCQKPHPTRCLTDEQRRRIERSARLVPLDVHTIEMAGGSVRCKIAGIHLSPRMAAA